jgi:hypothetical protein
MKARWCRNGHPNGALCVAKGAQRAPVYPSHVQVGLPPRGPLVFLAVHFPTTGSFPRLVECFHCRSSRRMYSFRLIIPPHISSFIGALVLQRGRGDPQHSSFELIRRPGFCETISGPNGRYVCIPVPSKFRPIQHLTNDNFPPFNGAPRGCEPHQMWRSTVLV